MLAAYLDESRSHGETPVFAVSGYLSPTTNWHYDFVGPWERVLAREHLEYFHMNQFESRQGAYKEWSNEKRLAVISELAGIIKRSVWVGVGTAVSLSDYNGLTAEEKELVGTPYHLCALWSMKLLSQWLDQHHVAARVAYVFEDGAEGAGEVSRGAFENAERDFHVLGVHFADKRHYPQLQAADVIAYETPKQALRTMGKDSREIRKLLKSLLSGVPHASALFDAAGLAGLCEDARKKGFLGR